MEVPGRDGKEIVYIHCIFITQHGCDIAVDALTFYIVGITHHGCLSNIFMQHKGTFNLCCTHTMPRYIQNIIDTTGYPVVTIFIYIYIYMYCINYVCIYIYIYIYIYICISIRTYIYIYIYI